MNVYYNEHDRFAAEWLRGLISGGHLPAGHVDERDIQDVRPDDLRGFDQCHFFAGIGGWALALELAEWGDRPVWTGSCPCQPYSSAGKGEGASDARNLWPEWLRLIRECRPPVVLGEQVEAAVRHGWLDAVSTDLEAEGYAFGSAVLGAHSVGAPHIRQRLWWVADSQGGDRGLPVQQRGPQQTGAEPERSGEACSALADPTGPRSARTEQRREDRGSEGEELRNQKPERDGAAGVVGDPNNTRPQGRRVDRIGSDECATRPSSLGHVADTDSERVPASGRADSGAGVDGPWADAIWLPCRDGKARPTRAGLQPLAHGVRNRVGALRGAGNAIVPQTAEAFIRAYLETVA